MPAPALVRIFTPPARLALAFALAALAPAPAAAVVWPWEIGDPWPTSSDEPVRPLERPDPAAWFAAHPEAAAGEAAWRFAVFGDQRALADEEWPALMRAIDAWREEHGELAFLLDTGDIVDDGRHTDQFAYLEREILSILPDLPYLVGVGNHELHNNRESTARAHTATFLAGLDPAISPDRFWYRVDLGGATFLFLDTNDLVYGETGERTECPAAFAPGGRVADQLAWLETQLGTLRDDPDRLVFAVMHHPLVQSSRKHRETAASLWNADAGGAILAERLADGGVDVILTGHTHTYERFGLTRADGTRIELVNLSGRPRDSWLWFGADDRRAIYLGYDATPWLVSKGWWPVEGWQITQEEVMAKADEANQFAVFTVEPDGGLVLEVVHLDADSAPGFRRADPVRLR